MAYPVQTFSTLAQALAYANTVIVTNGRKEIDAIEANNVFNALGKFIVEYTVNGYANGATVASTGGAISLTTPVTVVTAVLPDSITWQPNIQKEFYITNTLSEPIPLSGVSFYDFALQQQTEIPILSTIHIAQATNGNWVQVNNLGGEASDVPNSATPTDAIEVTATGVLNRDISASLNLDPASDNIAEITAFGLKVPQPDIPSGALRGDS